MTLPNPWIILGAVGAWALSLMVVGWLFYARGHDDMRNAVTEQQLASANQNLKISQINATLSQKAGAQHDTAVQVVHDTTRTIVQTVQLPAAADPFLPVGFVRLWDRAASRTIGADPYPGKSDGDPSDVRVSEAQNLLVTDWADKYAACRQQVIDIAALKPVLPTPLAPPSQSWLDSLNPFNTQPAKE